MKIFIPGSATVYCDGCGKVQPISSLNLYNVTPQSIIDTLQYLDEYWETKNNKLYCSYYCMEESEKLH